jgi:NifU-like domain
VTQVTLKSGIEGMLKHYIPEVRFVWCLGCLKSHELLSRRVLEYRPADCASQVQEVVEVQDESDKVGEAEFAKMEAQLSM